MLLRMIATYLETVVSVNLKQFCQSFLLTHRNKPYPPEAKSMLLFIEILERYYPVSQQLWEELIPPYLIAQFDRS